MKRAEPRPLSSHRQIVEIAFKRSFLVSPQGRPGLTAEAHGSQALEVRQHVDPQDGRQNDTVAELPNGHPKRQPNPSATCLGDLQSSAAELASGKSRSLLLTLMLSCSRHWFSSSLSRSHRTPQRPTIAKALPLAMIASTGFAPSSTTAVSGSSSGIAAPARSSSSPG